MPAPRTPPHPDAGDMSSPAGRTGSGESPVHDQRPGLWGRLVRAGATSVAATVLSHGIYVALLAITHADATIASAVAFVCGAIFNYLVGRRITWGRRGRPHPLRETVPYLLVIGCSGLLSVGVATLTQHLIAGLHLSNAGRTLVLELANIASYGAVFLVKFSLLDRWVFRRP